MADLLARLQIPPMHRVGLDGWVWWLMQYKRHQLRRRWKDGGHDPAKLDLMYIHTQTAAAALLDLPPTVPAVVSIDLTWRLAFRESRYVGQSPFFYPVYGLEKAVYDRADLVVSFSDWAAQSVIEDYKIPASKVQVVRNGVTLPPALGPTAPATNGASPLMRFGFIGNQFQRKGGDLLLRLHQDRFADRAHLTIVTNDPPKPETVGELKNVEILSEVPWDKLMSQVLPSFDLFVFPSRFDYSPYAVIEAMTAGVPVVATRVGSVPEMIEDGYNGFLVRPGSQAQLADRLEWALTNRAALPAMGERGRQRAAAAYAAEKNYPYLIDMLYGVARSPRLLPRTAPVPAQVPTGGIATAPALAVQESQAPAGR
jgi:glycosyltransferase involved in cell wall biosynthesis